MSAGSIKNTSFLFLSFNCCISGESCSLSCCETCKSATAQTNASLPAAALVPVPPPLSFFSLRCYFSSAFEFSTSRLKIGLSAHTPLHKLNSPLQALTGLSAYESASPGFIQAEKVGVEKLPFHKQKLLKRYHLNTVLFPSSLSTVFAAAGVVENNSRTLTGPWRASFWAEHVNMLPFYLATNNKLWKGYYLKTTLIWKCQQIMLVVAEEPVPTVQK